MYENNDALSRVTPCDVNTSFWTMMVIITKMQNVLICPFILLFARLIML